MPRTRKKPVEQTGSRQHLTLLDLSDREFLLVLDDVADDDGWADSLQVATALDLSQRRLASSRLSWLARWGVVEREHQRDASGNIRYRRNGQPFYTQRWRMTDAGRDYALGELGKRQQNALDAMASGGMVALTRYVAQYARSADLTGAKLMSREWRYGLEHVNGRR